MAEEYVFVAGVTYPVFKDRDKPEKGLHFKLRPFSPGDWRAYCTRRAYQIMQARQRLDLKFTLFDFNTGTREVIDFDNRGSPRCTVQDKSYGKVDPVEYRLIDLPSDGDYHRATLVHPPPKKEFRTPQAIGPQVVYFGGASLIESDPLRFADYYSRFYSPGAKPPPTTMSVVDVYKYLAAIGSSQPHSIHQLHVFAHSFREGPIFINTRESDPGALRPDSDQRDPLDRDARLKDLGRAHVVDFALLRNAFAESAMCFIWGCQARTFTRRMVNQAERQSRTIADSTDKKIFFRWDGNWGVTRDSFHRMLGGLSGTSAGWSKEAVGAHLRKQQAGTYMQQLANVTGQVVVGALPGTYSNFDQGGAEKDRLLHIPMKLIGDEEVDFRAVLNFYQTYADAELYTEDKLVAGYGRGYAVYRPGKFAATGPP